GSSADDTTSGLGDAGALLAEVPRRFDGGAEVQALVLRLLDQHHGLERVDVVDPLLLALGGNLGLVRPVVELHLRDPGDLADLPEVQLDLAEVVGQIDRFEKIDLPAHRHRPSPRRVLTLASYKAHAILWEERAAVSQRWVALRLRRGPRRGRRRGRRPSRPIRRPARAPNPSRRPRGAASRSRPAWNGRAA